MGIYLQGNGPIIVTESSRKACVLCTFYEVVAI
jgi:hypothetical protein